MKKIESESARAARQARIAAEREKTRTLEREAREADREIEERLAHDHVGRERAEIARRAALQSHSANHHSCELVTFPDFVVDVNGPTPGRCCMCSRDPSYTKKPTWSVGINPKRSFCRECMRNVFGRTPKDLDPSTGAFKR